MAQLAPPTFVFSSPLFSLVDIVPLYQMVGGPESVDPRIKALHGSDNRTRLEAVRALAAIKHGAVKRSLPAVSGLLKDPDPAVAAEAAALAAT
jgi:hypothetical protein